MSAKNRPTIEYLRQCFREENGKIFWLNRPREHFKKEWACRAWNSRMAHKEAGNKADCSGYKRCRIKVAGKGLFLRSVIVWALIKGEWPDRFLDHKNRDCLDDRIGNLRLATMSQNQGNAGLRRNNTSGFKGVTYGHKKWRAGISVNGKMIYLGSYANPAEAHQAYLKAAQKHFGEFACGG